MTPTTATTLNPEATNLTEIAALHAQLLVNVIGFATGSSGDAPTASTPYTTQRPWIVPPDEYVPFDDSNVIPLPAVGTTATVLILNAANGGTVPIGMDGVINKFSWNFTGGGFDQGSGDLVVQILRGAAAVRNFDNILQEKGTIQLAREISPIRIYSGQIIKLIITHKANGLLNGNVIASFQGYYYPSKS